MDAHWKIRVLLVDDDEDCLWAMCESVRTIGYEPLAASSMAEARRVLSRWREEPCALALIDNRLGDGFGVDLLPELSELDPPPAVALISGFLNPDLATRAFRLGAIALGRPTDLETLRHLLETLAQHPRRTSLTSLHVVVQTLHGPEPKASAEAEGRSLCGASPLRARRKILDPAPLTFGPFTLRGRSLMTPIGPLRLRNAEAKLLGRLASKRPSAVGILELAKLVLGRDDEGGRRSLHTHVWHLRVRLGRYAALVTTEPKRGYRLALDGFAL